MEIDLKKEQRKVVNNLETIFNAPSMKAALLQSNLQSLIEKQLNILTYLETTNKSKTIKSDKLLTTYNQLANKHFVIDKNIKYADDEILVDDINYLGVYIRNIYKTDLDALAAGKDAKVDTPTVGEAPTQQAAAAGAFPFMMPGMAGNLPPEQNPVYTAMANARIQQETAQGKVYLFKTKPKYIPILKWIISILLMLFSLSAAFVAIGMLCTNGASRAGNMVVGQGTLNDYLNILTACPYLLLTIVAMFVGYRTFSPLIKDNKNENRLYAFTWRFYAMLGFLFVMLLSFGGAWGVDLWIFKPNMVPWVGTENPTQMFGLWAWFIGYVGLISTAILLIVGIVLGSIKGPKIDTERLSALMRQYIDESSKAPPPIPPGMQ